MPLTPVQFQQIMASAKGLGFAAPIERVDDFSARVLGLNPFQRVADLTPGTLANIVAQLSGHRESTLRSDNQIPNYAVFDDVAGVTQISGLSTYLAQNHDRKFLDRFSQHAQIRTALQRLGQGHNLEALAAAIMQGLCGFGQATRGSSDQGVDSFGSKELARIDRSLIDGTVKAHALEPLSYPGESVYLMASSKAVVAPGPGQAPLLDPAHIRELVGGWTIQRSPASAWQGLGIRTLTPLQLVLVTTYRTSLALSLIHI